MGDLTPEETLRERALMMKFPTGGDAFEVVHLSDALAAVAAERERLGERLLSDEAVDAAWCAMDDLREKRQTTVVGPDSGQWQTAPRAALSAAWRVATGSNHE